MNKEYLLFLCVCSFCLPCLKAQNCFNSGDPTNGIQSELIRADNGSLLGIRVSWSWSSIVTTQPWCFQSADLEIELYTSSNERPFRTVREGINVTRLNNSVNFSDLDCNVMYTPKVKANIPFFRLVQSGSPLLFGAGSLGSPPSVLSRVCVGPPASGAGGELNISWDLLPCHLQNGADVTSYVIQYTQLSTGLANNISTDSQVAACGPEESGDRYSCLLPLSLFLNGQMYSFKVAARNSFGFGSLSNPVTSSVPVSSQGGNCAESSFTEIEFELNTITTDSPTTAPESTDSLTSTTFVYSQTSTSSVSTDFIEQCTCQQAWTLMGSLIAVITVLAGMVILVQFIVNYTLWMRLKNLKQDQNLQCGNIDMKECSAYGQAVSTQPVNEQQHIYDTTT